MKSFSFTSSKMMVSLSIDVQIEIDVYVKRGGDQFRSGH